MPASDWQNHAACRDANPDLFAYDPSTDPPATAEAAKTICAGCPVTDDCLSFALSTFALREDRTGIYGGRTPAERRQLEHVDRRRRDGSDPEWASRTFAKASESASRPPRSSRASTAGRSSVPGNATGSARRTAPKAARARC